MIQAALGSQRAPLSAFERHLESMTAAQALLRDRGVTAMLCLKVGEGRGRESSLTDESRLEIEVEVARMS